VEFYILGAKAKGVFMQAHDRGLSGQTVDRDDVEPARADAALGKEVSRGASQPVLYARSDAPVPVR
jgi:hypothetical protein